MRATAVGERILIYFSGVLTVSRWFSRCGDTRAKAAFRVLFPWFICPVMEALQATACHCTRATFSLYLRGTRMTFQRQCYNSKQCVGLGPNTKRAVFLQCSGLRVGNAASVESKLCFSCPRQAFESSESAFKFEFWFPKCWLVWSFQDLSVQGQLSSFVIICYLFQIESYVRTVGSI